MIHELTILPEEIYFSWVSRMYMMNMLPRTIFLQELIGTSRLLVYQVRPLRRQMKTVSLDDIIAEHSLFPIIKPFTTTEWYTKTIEEIKQGKLTGRLDRNQEFKVCPCCYMDDMKELGQAYLRREHQIEGNLVCWQHKVDLKKIKRYKSKDSQELFTSDLTLEELEVSYAYKDPLYWKISDMIHSIFKNRLLDNMDLQKVQERYRERLRELEYADNKYVIRQEKLAKAIGEYYGDRLAVLLGEELDINKKWNWIVSMTKEHFRVKPIAHMLMIYFLFGGIEEFINYKPEKLSIYDRAFGLGPWECINEMCSNFKEPVINSYIIKEFTMQKVPRGIFTCPNCECTYVIDSNNKKIKIVDRGNRWNDNALEFYRQGLSVYMISKVMKCSKYEIECTLHKSGVFDKYKNVSAKELEESKKEIINYIVSNPLCSRRDIRRATGTHYNRVFKDEEWCQENLPPLRNQGIKTKEGIREWNKKDIQYANEIKILAERILANNEPVWISKEMFQRELNYSGLKDPKILPRMPLSKKALDKYCENKKEYYERIRTNKSS